MKLTHHTVTWGLLALLAVAACFALAGAPLISPEALASIGMVPLATGSVSTAEFVEKSMNEILESDKAFKARHTQELAEVRAAIEDIQKKANRPATGGGFNHATSAPMTAAERKSFDGAVRALMAGDKAKADALFVEAKAMSVGSDPDGGYMVHTQFSSGFTKVMAEVSPLYRLARVIDLDAGHDGFEEPIDKNAADATWVGEQESRPETNTPQLGMFSLTLREIYAMPKVTQKLVDLVSFDVMGWLQTKVGEAFGTKEGAAFHDGNGVAKPRGFLTHDIATTTDATRAWGTIQYIPSGASGAFATASATVSPADALVDMTTALKPQYRAGAVWLMNRNTAGVVRKFKDLDGRYVWTDSLIVGQPATLLGYPVEIDDDMPNIAANSLSVAFGNFNRAYTIIQKPGIKFLPDPFTAKPHVLLYSYRRVDGGMNNSEAIKLLKMATA